MIDIITPKQQEILMALARFKFLTTSQMVRLGIDKHSQNLNGNLVKLRERKRKLINHINFGMGKEYFYFLTQKGKQLLVDHLYLSPDEIKAPIGRTSFFSTDYNHRKSCISCIIEMMNSASQEGFEIEFCDWYFEKTGNNRRDKNLQSKSRIELTNRYIEADAIFMTSRANEKFLYVFEYERKRDSRYIYKKCRDYLEALTIGEPSIKYGFNKGCRVLYVFETPAIMKAVISRIQQDNDFRAFHKHFLFKHFKELESAFFSDWLSINNENMNAY